MGLFLSCGGKLLFLSSADGMSGNLLSCVKGVTYSFKAQEEGGISLKMLQRKRASSGVEGRMSWFFSSCGRILEVSLEFRRGPQGPARLACEKSSLHSSCEGLLGICLQLLQGHRDSLS